MDKKDLAQDKALIEKAFKQHDAQEHKGGKGTTLKAGSRRYSAKAPCSFTPMPRVAGSRWNLNRFFCVS